MNCNNICPEFDCVPVLSCINTDLVKVSLGTAELTNFCTAVIKCVDAEFEAFKNGQETAFDFYPQSLLTVFRSLTGYSETGDFQLVVSNGNFSWLSSAAVNSTYVDNGIGINVSGNGSLSNPFKPNLITSYVQSLFNGSNGITYLLGSMKLGGTLNQNTTITGGGFGLTLTGLTQSLISASTVSITGGNAPTNYGQAAFTSVQSVFQLVSGTDIYSLNFDDVSKIATLKSPKDLIIQDGTAANPSIIGSNKTFFKVVNYHHATTNDVLALANNATGEVKWITPSSSGGTYTDEQAQDAVGSILTNTATVSLVYNDGSNTISANVNDGSTTLSKLQAISTDTILGRDSAGSGSVEQLTASGGIEFSGSGSIQIGSFSGDVSKLAASSTLTIVNDAVTDVKLRNSIAYSVIGRSTTGIGDPADIVASVDQVLRRSGSGDLLFGTLVTNNIGDDQVTFPKIQNINTNRLVGRSTTGIGDIEEVLIGNGLNLAGGTLSTFGRVLIGISKYFVDGTWTKPAGCNAVLVYTVGAGGGGGGSTSASAQAATAGGGSGGAHSLHFLTAGLGASETILVGVGGVGGNLASSYNGQAGTLSSFGSHTAVNGGLGGFTLASGTTPAVVYGGASVSTFFKPTGSVYFGASDSGCAGIRLSGTVAIDAKGGVSILGGGGNASSPGAGGDGKASSNGGSIDGNSGSGGIVVVYEFT